MITLFTLIFLISVITTIALLIKPSWTTKGRTTILSRWKILLFGLVASFVSLAIIGVLAPKVEHNKINTKNSPSEQVVNEEKPTVIPPKPVIVEDLSKKEVSPVQTEENLGITPEDFRKEFNRKLKDLNIDSIRPVAEFDLTKGGLRNTFNVKFSDAIELIGTVNKDGNLRELNFIMGGAKDYEHTMMEMLVLTGLSAQIINPNSDGKANQAVVDLINKSLKGIKKEKNTHSKIIDHVKYYALASQTTGLWVGISADKND